MEKLEAIESGRLRRLIVMVPPRHGKSELCSIQFPVWYLSRDPKREVICCSYSADLAVDFGRKARNLFMDDSVRYVFESTIAQDSQAAGNWSTSAGGSYVAAGVGGAITGKGANLLIIDDPIKNREDAESDLIRDKIWDWYRSTAYTRLAPDGAVIVIQTRWHDDDLAGRLLHEMKSEGDQWDVISFPAVATADEGYRVAGEPLWPEKFDLQKLADIKKVIGSYEWASLYQQDPINVETQEFNPNWFLYRDFDNVQQLDTRKFLTIDTAVSKRKRSDFTGFCENYVDKENKWNIRAWQKKLNPTELVDTLFTLHKNNRYDKIGIEVTMYLQTLKPFLEEEMRKRNMWLPITELSHAQRSKDLRIRGLIPRYESRSIYHIKGQCKDLESQLVRFPKARHDDVMDALAYQLDIAEAPIPVGEEVNFGLYASNFE